jgi:GTP cyclohydrolase IA
MLIDHQLLTRLIENGDHHNGSSRHTPIREDAFDLSRDEKIAIIADKFRDIMLTLGLDLEDDSLSGTPYRVAKMYVEEIFGGLLPENLPNATLFDNKYGYHQMIVEKNIKLQSMCEHHFVPIIGTAHVAYFSSGQVIGLSKIHRIVKYFAQRPQVQERLTMDIADHLCQVLETRDVAVVIDAKHYCVQMRGIEDPCSSTLTCEYRGKFEQPQIRANFLQYLQSQP